MTERRTQAGEQAAVEPIGPSTPVRLSIVGPVLAALCVVGGAALAARATLAGIEDRQTQAEARIRKLEDTSAERALVLQKLQDDLDHIRQTTDQTARDVRAMQRGGGR